MACIDEVRKFFFLKNKRKRKRPIDMQADIIWPAVSIKAAAMKSPIQEMQNIVAFACTEQLSGGSESICYNLISFPVVFVLDRNLLDYCMYLPKVPRDIFALLLF